MNMHSEPDGSDEVRQLMFQQVPELASGVVEIKGLVRNRGRRTMLAVHASNSSVDPVGACVGQNGIRIKTVVKQLSGEKMDIIRWSESTEEFIRHAIAPAQAARILLDGPIRRATIYAPPEQHSLILGREGLRRDLIARLVGWSIQVLEVPEIQK